MVDESNSPGLIDTDILIDAARRVADADRFLVGRRQLGLTLSVISAMELIAGCRNKTELGHVRQFLGTVTVLPISERISRAALDLIECYHLSHGLLLPDAFIAATAKEHGMGLYTKNSRHFQMIPGLSVVRPY